MPLFELLPDIFVPTFEIKVDGAPLREDVAKQIMQVSVTQTLADPSNFSFQLYDPKLELINPENGLFTEGKKVEISLGYVGNLRKMITGKISSLTADFPASGPPTLQVEGFDFLHDLTRGTAHNSSGGDDPDSSPPDSQLVSDEAAREGLSVNVDGTPARTLPRVQVHTTSFAFLQNLALWNGYLLWAEDGTLFFKRDRPPSGSIMLEWGKTLLSFSPRFSTVGQVNTVEVRRWDPIQKQTISGRKERPPTEPAEVAATGQEQIARGSGGHSELVITDAPVSSGQDAELLADAILSSLLQSTVTGSGASVGNPDLGAGILIEIKGTGRRFDNNYRVTRVTHTVSESGYQCSFEVNSALNLFGFSSSTDDLLSPSSGHDRGRMSGLAVGIVMANKDPHGLGRIKVKLPALSDEIGHWTRVATLMAGKERGSFFLPEVDDEVLVAFEQGDIARPYIIGALWNGQDKPPDVNADGKNNLRFIKSRSGHIVRLDDTDGKEKIEIIDKSGGNSVTFDAASNTITIKSAKDVVIEAPQGKISLSAKSIEVKSSAETKVEAQSTMNLKASATMTIKGARVNIN